MHVRCRARAGSSVGFCAVRLPPTPRRLRFLGKRISGGGSLPSTLSFTLGDLDFV